MTASQSCDTFYRQGRRQLLHLSYLDVSISCCCLTQLQLTMLRSNSSIPSGASTANDFLVSSHAPTSSFCGLTSLFKQGSGPVAVPRRCLWLMLGTIAGAILLLIYTFGYTQAILSLAQHYQTQMRMQRGNAESQSYTNVRMDDSAIASSSFALPPARPSPIKALLRLSAAQSVEESSIGKVEKPGEAQQIRDNQGSANTLGVIQKVTSVEAPVPSLSLPPIPAPPPTLELTQTDITRLEEPWRWFESSGEHKDLLKKVAEMRAELGRPLVILDIGLNIGSAPWAIERVCPDCIIYGFEPIPKYFAFAQLKLPRSRYPNVRLFNYAICDHVGHEEIWMDTETNVG
jgi:hypothetical protein